MHSIISLEKLLTWAVNRESCYEYIEASLFRSSYKWERYIVTLLEVDTRMANSVADLQLIQSWVQIIQPRVLVCDGWCGKL